MIFNHVTRTLIIIAVFGIVIAIALGAFFALKPKFGQPPDDAELYAEYYGNDPDRQAFINGQPPAENPPVPTESPPLRTAEITKPSPTRPSPPTTSTKQADEPATTSFSPGSRIIRPRPRFPSPPSNQAISTVNQNQNPPSSSAQAAAPSPAAPPSSRPVQASSPSSDSIPIPIPAQPSAAQNNQKVLHDYGRVVGLSFRNDYLYVPSYQNGKISVLRTPDLATLQEIQCPDCKIYDVSVLNTGDIIAVQGDQHKISKIDPTGHLVKQIDIPYATKGVTINQYNEIFVMDRTHERIHLYDSNLNYVGPIVIPQKQRSDCNFLTVNASDVIFASCEDAVYIFTAQGELIRKLFPPHDQSYSMGIDTDSQGRILVVRRGTGILDIYDSSGEFVEAVGEGNESFWSDIAVGNGFLYVVDYIETKIKVFQYV